MWRPQQLESRNKTVWLRLALFIFVLTIDCLSALESATSRCMSDTCVDELVQLGKEWLSPKTLGAAFDLAADDGVARTLTHRISFRHAFVAPPQVHATTLSLIAPNTERCSSVRRPGRALARGRRLVGRVGLCVCCARGSRRQQRVCRLVASHGVV